ncbi:MAG: AAA family ATPase, partial [Desulfobacterales bacterium]|nr:AAA family ATPase [Desulfobacterales bacterium]
MINSANPELQLADEFVRDTGCNIYLTGKAGTGKTTFLHNIKKQSPKRMIVTAPTGVAAINAGGVTLHSFFQMPFGPFVPGSETTARHKFNKEKVNIIKSLDLLVIDEISMVRSDLLDGIDAVLRRYRRSNLPFGGVQLLLIGDLHQLSPVVKDADWRILGQHYDSPYFFSSNALRQTELIAIELQHIYRQEDDHFIKLLNHVRDNKLDQATLASLNVRHIKGFADTDHEGEGYITLCTHNSNADA